MSKVIVSLSASPKALRSMEKKGDLKSIDRNLKSIDAQITKLQEERAKLVAERNEVTGDAAVALAKAAGIKITALTKETSKKFDDIDAEFIVRAGIKTSASTSYAGMTLNKRKGVFSFAVHEKTKLISVAAEKTMEMTGHIFPIAKMTVPSMKAALAKALKHAEKLSTKEIRTVKNYMK